MTTIRLTCWSCRTATSVASSAAVLGRDSEGVTSLTSVCPHCGRIVARVLDALDADELRASHVPCTTIVRRTTSAAPPAAPVLTPDDALDLHLALQRPTWFDELASTVPGIPAHPIDRTTDS